jgi:hypothetical protein
VVHRPVAVLETDWDGDHRDPEGRELIHGVTENRLLEPRGVVPIRPCNLPPGVAVQELVDDRKPALALSRVEPAGPYGDFASTSAIS